MSDLHSVVYVAAARTPLNVEECEALLLDESSSNLRSGTTGALLYVGGCFLGYLEGDPESVNVVRARVEASRRCTGLMVLLEKPIESRMFFRWHFACAEPSQSEIVRSATDRWKRALNHLDPRTAQPVAIGLLQRFWSNTW